ncbi:MAG: methylated-DNA--[protein]-cysteine S-methyltransferase [Deltaproteobacteria bacterium]
MSKGKQHEKGFAMRPAVVHTAPVKLPYGWASAVLSGGMLVSVEWEDSKERLAETLRRKFPLAVGSATDGSRPGKILKDYAGGGISSPGEISALSIAWDMAAGFHGRILQETAKIPYGRTVTYGELAAMAGSPGAARAAGAALARNPWPVIVPCHRVVGAGGMLVGFGKGLPAKEALLKFEERNLRLHGVAQ